MKFICVVFFVVCSVLIGNTVAKNPICYQKFKYNGDLRQQLCFGTQPMWSYNVMSDKCTEFMWNPACGGNDNLFGTKEICEKACVTSDFDSEEDFGESPNCSYPHSAGQLECRGIFPSWTYNQDARQCIEFTYGGCKGNGNRFHSYQECAKECYTIEFRT